MKKMIANKNSYDSIIRNRDVIKYIVIHYTGNNNDTAKSNCIYFQKQTERKAGAHFFIDDTEIIKSVPLNRTAWSVGGFYSSYNGAGKYYKKCTNFNSVSIELCNNLKNYPSKKQIKLLKKCIKYIKKYCKNADVIIRHWDVNGKECPLKLIGEYNYTWDNLKKELYKSL